MVDKRGLLRLLFQVGLTDNPSFDLMDFADDAEFISLGEITLAANTTTVVPVTDFTSTSYTMGFLFIDPDKTDNVSVKLNGQTELRAVKPFCLASEKISGIIGSNSHATLTRKMQVYGIINKSP